MVNFGFSAYEKTRINGVTYRTVKTTRKEKKAEEFKKSLPVQSRRHPPFVERVSIGLHLGYLYRVKVPVEE